ncbi:hypothetical protein [Carnobacterium mobile]|uniref:hypothetical protein n=1 Tax=Carnobacterium mobile TaxID=2750 RepID=UPI00054E4317|nr:hypothetical protein [Carnobacterium mobile]
MKNAIKYYAVTYWICFVTAWFGFLLIYNAENVIERLKLFEDSFDIYVGLCMIVLSITKVVSLLSRWQYVKKISLIGIALMWLLVTWFYLNSPTTNTSYVISIGMAGLCYIQLYRGDYSD